MLLTVKKLEEAVKEAKRKDAYIYVVYSNSEVQVWVNSASPSSMSSGTDIIKTLSYGDIEYDNVIYKNYQLGLQEFCNIVNKEYGEVKEA